eukprot:TRINITY_DN15529_c0_g1_i1.p1 TRINITY_DN15529_c0_g1~~TRINITY_DN15529_c0_g1_i1.p1  ORF type:complete len:287 (-),score=57.48 TRINITY_DN15529_c0_g1_i1:14-874(-)
MTPHRHWLDSWTDESAGLAHPPELVSALRLLGPRSGSFLDADIATDGRASRIGAVGAFADVSPQPSRRTMRRFYEEVGGAATLAAEARMSALKALRRLRDIQNRTHEMFLALPPAPPADDDNERPDAVNADDEPLDESERDLMKIPPVPPWEVAAQPDPLLRVREAARRLAADTDFVVQRLEGAEPHFRRSVVDIAHGDALSKVYQRSRGLVSPSVLGGFEAVKEPPPLVYRFSGQSPKPGLWCRKVCHTAQKGDYPEPPWRRHSQAAVLPTPEPRGPATSGSSAA